MWLEHSEDHVCLVVLGLRCFFLILCVWGARVCSARLQESQDGVLGSVGLEVILLILRECGVQESATCVP